MELYGVAVVVLSCVGANSESRMICSRNKSRCQEKIMQNYESTIPLYENPSMSSGEFKKVVMCIIEN